MLAEFLHPHLGNEFSQNDLYSKVEMRDKENYPFIC
jgi:hypothetical protein